MIYNSANNLLVMQSHANHILAMLLHANNMQMYFSHTIPTTNMSISKGLSLLAEGRYGIQKRQLERASWQLKGIWQLGLDKPPCYAGIKGETWTVKGVPE